MKKRVAWIDRAKGIAIILVVLGHNLTLIGSGEAGRILNIFIYSFHMPLFFILSGCTLNVNTPLKHFLKKKFRVLMVSNLLFSGLMFLFQFLIHYSYYKDFHSWIKSLSNAENVWNTILFTNRSSFGGYWFLPVLFCGQLICFLLVKYIHNLQYRILALMGMFILGVGLGYYKVALPLGVGEACLAAPFIYLGLEFQRRPDLLSRLRKVNIVCFFLFIISNLMGIRHGYGTMNMCCSDINNIVSFWINSLTGSILCMSIAQNVQVYRGLEWIGKNSLWIFGIHYMVLEVCYCINKEITCKIIDNKTIWALLYTLTNLVICVLIISLYKNLSKKFRMV